MARMVNPYSRKAVEVPEGLAGRFREAGFIEEEPEVVGPKRVSAPTARRSRKAQ